MTEAAKILAEHPRNRLLPAKILDGAGNTIVGGLASLTQGDEQLFDPDYPIDAIAAQARYIQIAADERIVLKRFQRYGNHFVFTF